MNVKKPNDRYTNPLTGKLVFDSIKPLDLTNFTKDDVKTYFDNSYDLYETLFTSLKYDSVYYLCPDRLRLPLIFYYGHTAAVFMNKLCLAGLIKPKERIRFDLDMTFETGVDEMSWDDTEHYRMGGNYKWPTVEETKEFRAKVRNLIYKVIDRTPLELPVTWDSPWWALFMGFEHERIHFETSTVLIRQYPVELVQRPLGWSYAPFQLSQDKNIIKNEMVKVPETQVRLGKKFEFPSYGWDNEYGQVDCKVSAFEASKFKITNEQFLEFVLDDGYLKREYWSDEGWQWVKFKQAKHPLFWICPMKCKSGCGGPISTYSHCQEHHFSKSLLDMFKSHNSKEQMKNFFNDLDENQNQSSLEFPFKLRLMFDIVDMPKNWPVEVNYHEAKAFCRWKGEDFRCISEAEHHAIREYDVLDLDSTKDIIYQIHSKVNHNMAYGSSTPVDLHPANSKGFHDVFGNVWEWTEDNFNGLPGTKTHFLYDDFSSPCYDGRHNLIMGGSWASTGDEASCFARFMFRRHFYQHCGFRLVRSLPTCDGSKPNPQIRLVKDHIFVLGAGTPNNQVDLDENKVQVEYFETTNKQYLYDSHLNEDYFENEIIDQHKKPERIEKLIENVNKILDEYPIEEKIATHLGCSTGRLVFDLTKRFDEVVGVDFCGKFLDIALKIQSQGEVCIKVGSDDVCIKCNQMDSVNKAIFKQMTWIPNEIPKSELVVFSMIDRVENHLSWLKRLREIVRPNGLLIIYSEKAKWTSKNLNEIFDQIFDLINESSLNDIDCLSLWKMKPSYAAEYL